MTQCAKTIIQCWNIFSSTKTKLNFNLTYAGNFGGLAYSCCCKPFSNFPSKNSWIFLFALNDCGDDTGCEKPRSAPSNGLGLQESSAAVAAQDLTDTPVGHLKYAVTDAQTSVRILTRQYALVKVSH